MRDSMTGQTRRIKLKSGALAVVDADNYERFVPFRWTNGIRGGYAVRVIRANGKHKTIFMHREVMGVTDDDTRRVDHINGNPLDNRRENLRFATQRQNVWNKAKRRGSRSPYKGVSIVLGKNGQVYYRASCMTGSRKGRHLGHYPTEIDAAKAYDRRAWELFGEFARLNFPDGDPSTYPPITCNLHRWHGGDKCIRCGAPPTAEYWYHRERRLKKLGRSNATEKQ